MTVKRFDSVGNGAMHEAPEGHFVLFSDYQAIVRSELFAGPVATLKWERVEIEYSGGLEPTFYLEATTPFGTKYGLCWTHPGADELVLDEEHVYCNYDEIIAKYPVSEGDGPHWSASYDFAECEFEGLAVDASLEDARLICENDFLIRTSEALGCRLNRPVWGSAPSSQQVDA